MLDGQEEFMMLESLRILHCSRMPLKIQTISFLITGTSLVTQPIHFMIGFWLLTETMVTLPPVNATTTLYIPAEEWLLREHLGC